MCSARTRASPHRVHGMGSRAQAAEATAASLGASHTASPQHTFEGGSPVCLCYTECCCHRVRKTLCQRLDTHKPSRHLEGPGREVPSPVGLLPVRPPQDPPAPARQPDLQQQAGLHGLLAGDEVRLHEQDVLAQLLWTGGAVAARPGPHRPLPGGPRVWPGAGSVRSVLPYAPGQYLHSPRMSPRAEGSSTAQVPTTAARPGRTPRPPSPQSPYPTRGWEQLPPTAPVATGSASAPSPLNEAQTLSPPHQSHPALLQTGHPHP